MYLKSPKVIVWEEMPYPTCFQLDLFKARLKDITHPRKSYVMVVNLINTPRPDSVYRSELVNFLKANRGLIKRYFLATGNIGLINICVELTAKIAGVHDISTFTTFDQAIRKGESYASSRLISDPSKLKQN
ncbi:hypothetical protein [Pontibacter sp. G13]|uniref:hypothetical protein n=1 Tax=Pontibacter sp. G13 TaxID=3074898 RepID=UPI002888FCCA|nr:hypothetical protein [Pontibacter sp. G13]WNJ17261.1 hypothetical protein RJD25_20590 [Pontibacter sp. G13]